MTCVRQHYQANFGWSELIFTLINNHSDISHENQKKTYHFEEDQDPACDFSADPDQEQYFPAMRILWYVSGCAIHIRMCNTYLTSVADPRCLSRSWILKFIHTGSRVPNLGSWIQQRAKNITKLKIILFLNRNRYIWAYSKGSTELFTQKIVAKLSETWVWDPGSEFRDCKNSFLDPGVKKSTGSRFRIRNSDLHHPQQQCNITLTFFKRSVTTVQTVSFSNFYKMACPQLHPWNVRCHGWW